MVGLDESTLTGSQSSSTFVLCVLQSDEVLGRCVTVCLGARASAESACVRASTTYIDVPYLPLSYFAYPSSPHHGNTCNNQLKNNQTTALS